MCGLCNICLPKPHSIATEVQEVFRLSSMKSMLYWLVSVFAEVSILVIECEMTCMLFKDVSGLFFGIDTCVPGRIFTLVLLFKSVILCINNVMIYGIPAADIGYNYGEYYCKLKICHSMSHWVSVVGISGVLSHVRIVRIASICNLFFCVNMTSFYVHSIVAHIRHAKRAREIYCWSLSLSDVSCNFCCCRQVLAVSWQTIILLKRL